MSSVELEDRVQVVQGFVHLVLDQIDEMALPISVNEVFFHPDRLVDVH